jgi:hypothetical protein
MLILARLTALLNSGEALDQDVDGLLPPLTAPEDLETLSDEALLLVYDLALIGPF